MNIRETYKYLESVEKVNAIIENKKADKESVLNLGTSTTQANDGLPHASGTSDKVGSAAVKMRYIDCEIDNCVNILLEFKKEVESELLNLSVDQYDVIYKFYVLNKGINEIVEHVAKRKNRKSFSRQRIFDIKKEGVQKLSENMQEESDTYRKVKALLGRNGW